MQVGNAKLYGLFNDKFKTAALYRCKPKMNLAKLFRLLFYTLQQLNYAVLLGNRINTRGPFAVTAIKQT
jgi:hypothetical protein